MKKTKNMKFTIIELLVVISIISILTTLLLPALKRARSTSQRMYCVNNIKNYGVLSSIYSSTYDGWMVPGMNGIVGSTAKRWYQHLFEISGSKDKSSFCYDPAYRWVHAKTEKAYSSSLIPYGYNERLSKYFTNSGGYHETSRLRMFQVKRPSEIISFADSDEDAYYGCIISSDAYPIGVRHDGMGVISFVDGHATVESPQKYTRILTIRGFMNYSSDDGKPNIQTTTGGSDTTAIKRAWQPLL